MPNLYKDFRRVSYASDTLHNVSFLGQSRGRDVRALSNISTLTDYFRALKSRLTFELGYCLSSVIKRVRDFLYEYKQLISQHLDNMHFHNIEILGFTL